MKKIKHLLIFIAIAIMLSSCATIISGHKQMVSFSTKPSEAKIVVDGQTIGTTPLTTKIKRTSHSVIFQKEDYRDAEYYFHSKFNGWYLGNLLLGGIPGMVVDLITGSYRIIDDNVYKELEKK